MNVLDRGYFLAEAYKPQADGLYKVLIEPNGELERAVGMWNSRKEIWLTEDGGEFLDVVYWNKIGEKVK